MKEQDFINLKKEGITQAVIIGDKETLNWIKDFQHTVCRNSIPYSIYGIKIFITNKMDKIFVLKEDDIAHWVEELKNERR